MNSYSWALFLWKEGWHMPKVNQSFISVTETALRQKLDSSLDVRQKPAIVLDLYPTAKGFKVQFGVNLNAKARRFLANECPKYVQRFVVKEMKLRPSSIMHSPLKRTVDIKRVYDDIRRSRVLVISGSPLDVSLEVQPSNFAARKVDEITTLMGMIRKYNDRVAPNKKIRIFGICAGHQIIHHASGGEVTPLLAPANGIRSLSSPFLSSDEVLNVLAVNQFRVSKMGQGFVSVMSDASGSDNHVITTSDTATTIQYHPERTKESYEKGQRIKKQFCNLGPTSLNRAGVTTVLARLIQSRQVSMVARVRGAMESISGSTSSLSESEVSSQSSEAKRSVFC